MHQIKIQTKPSQLLITQINQGTNHLFLNLPLDEYIDNSKYTNFEFQMQDQMKHN
jgi:hypothetical protein